jgi:UTP:GlnB (protein PII) uridylyltransferase
VCAYDEARPGLLAKICGALTALKVKVHTASVFTLNVETPVILDTLQISDSYLGHDRRLGKSKQPKIRAALEEVLVDAPPISQFFHRPSMQAALKVHEVRCEAAPAQEQKLITIRTAKNRSAVLRMAAAMASLGFDIQAAQIHQSDNDVHGIFFVRGEIEGDMEYQLRFALQSHSLQRT